MTGAGQRKRMSATKKADALFSKMVRGRGRCEMTELFPAIKCNGNLQCAHLVSRRYRSLRWLPENSFCACAAHHLYQTHHPLEYEAAMEREYPGNLDELKRWALTRPPMDAHAVVEVLMGQLNREDR